MLTKPEEYVQSITVNSHSPEIDWAGLVREVQEDTLEEAAAIVAQHNLGPGGAPTTWHVRIIKRIMDLLPKEEVNGG